MKFPVLTRKNISQGLIIIGLGLIMYAIISINMWRHTQNTLKENIENTEVISYEENILKKNTEKTEVISYVENIEENVEIKEHHINKIKEINETDIEVDSQIQDETIKREDYESGMMIIDIPKLKVRAGVMRGTSKEELKEGPGLYEISPLVTKEGGNVCIAGHRDVYGAWFLNVDKLIAGDDIFIEFNSIRYNYKVERVFIVAKNDWSVTKPTGYSTLTLTTCHPLNSSKQRMIVRAKLEKTEHYKNNEKSK